MISIALTGGIACGKSLFGRYLAAEGAERVDADEIVRQLHSSGGAAAIAVAELFGNEFLLPDGSTNRSKLSALIFGDASARLRLEAFLHPLVREKLLQWRDSVPAPDVRVAEIPLLFESGWQSDWDLTVTVETSDPEKRVARIVERGKSPEDARAIIAAQMTQSKREALADFVVRNDGDEHSLRDSARKLYTALLRKKHDQRN